MQIDLNKIGIKESALIVFAATVGFQVIFASLFQADVYLSPFLAFLPFGVAENFLQPLFSISAAIVIWWATAALTDFVAGKIFNLEDYGYLIPAYMICYAASLCLAFAINLMRKYFVPFDRGIAGLSLLIVAFLIYSLAIKDVYEIRWGKAMLILLLMLCIVAGLIFVGYGTGIMAGVFL